MAVLVLVGAAVYALVWLPEQQFSVDFKEITDTKTRVALADQYRRTYAQIIGGVVVAFGLFVAFYRSWAAMRMAKATEEGNLTERFTRAVDQLGALYQADGKSHVHVVVRQGGVFALEQIAKDAPAKFHWQIIETLTAYTRARVPLEAGPQGRRIREPDGNQRLIPFEDLQAALTVIGRRNIVHDPAGQAIDLSHIALVGADLRRARFDEANFRFSNTRDANFEAASLRKAFFHCADLNKAFFVDADLRQAFFSFSDARKAMFLGANAKCASFEGAKLQCASFAGAKLQKAVFHVAEMDGADFSQANLENVKALTKGQFLSSRFDEKTILPDGTSGHTREELEAWNDKQWEAAGFSTRKKAEWVSKDQLEG